ncbi:GNAT family N-acetyltransferase [Pseudooceanicola sediminis]|uniref:GNAT family N-acetyltransferase n=1 Tax=Pseudooceanicola sediminis TaxID=2211117 RepID=A0A399IXW7_9RHOB|nr:GNAT family N-acetyltransferase [Pseudooceanicola sediminis]KAA2313173.1 GNAT family N-acetyltransferase [Puniceibacterium sp. HSS470]RII37820.1 GNAT family N-acetyltransferase [Pseudooceanicola sediminis]
MIARALRPFAAATDRTRRDVVPRPARLYNVPALARILWSFTRDTDWMPQVRHRGMDVLLLVRLVLRGSVRLICDDDGPCAFIAREGDLIHALYVHARARRRGHGRALLSEAKATRTLLALWTPVESNTARRFYAAEGFSTAAYGDGSGNDEALPEVLMIWQKPQVHRQDTA